MVTTWVPAAALVPKPPTASCDAVQAVIVGGNVVVVVMSPPGGGIVVTTVDSAATVLVLVGAEELVHPASISVMATVARAPSLRTLGIYSTGAGGRDVGGPRPVERGLRCSLPLFFH